MADPGAAAPAHALDVTPIGLVAGPGDRIVSPDGTEATRTVRDERVYTRNMQSMPLLRRDDVCIIGSGAPGRAHRGYNKISLM